MSPRIGRRFAVVIALLPAAVIGIGMSSGSAAARQVRYASPHGGSTAACTKTAPCALTKAFDNLTDPTEIVVEPGTYGSAAHPLPLLGSLSSPKLYVHGIDEQHLPTIYLGADSIGIELANLSTLQRVKLISSASSSAMIIVGTLDHVISISSSPGGACEAYSESATIQAGIADSLCIVTAPSAGAIYIDAGGPNRTEIAGTTAISTGAGGIGLKVEEAHVPDSNHVTVIDSIVRGRAAGVTTSINAGTSASVTLKSSDYSLPLQAQTGAPITTQASDTTAAPKFVDPATNNYQERAGSPTIDRGRLSSGSDLAGKPRKIGAASDIGAYEFAPRPTGIHIKVTERGKTSLHLVLTMNNHDAASTAQLAYAHGTHRLTTTGKHVAASSSPTTVPLVLTGLRLNTRYSVRAIVLGYSGTTKSAAIHATTKKQHRH